MADGGSFHSSGVAWAILGVSLIVTAIAWYLSHSYIEDRATDRFRFRTAEVRDAVAQRMLEYEQVLRSGVGLFASSDHVSREEWRKFIDNSELQEYYPGIQGIGISEFVSREEKEAYEQAVREEGFPDFAIQPEGDRKRYGVVHYLEPFDWRNQRAFGYDMYSEPTRRSAMDQAIASGRPTISGMVTLVQETETDVQRGFLVYLPIFDRSLPRDTLEQKRAAVQGFVYAPFRANDLMQGILQSETSDIDFEIFDGETLTATHLLYDSNGTLHGTSDNAAPQFSETFQLNLHGRTWTLYFESKPGFIGPTESATSFLVACVGLLVDVLLFLVIGSIGRRHRHAAMLAESMTQAFRRQQKQFKAVCDSAHDPIVLIDARGDLIYANPATEKTFGFTAEELLGRSYRLLFQSAPINRDVRSLPPGSGVFQSVANTEQICLRRDGDAFQAEVSMSHWSEEGQPFSALVLRDVSDRKEKEALIRQTVTELERSNRDLDDFANIASHDLRSPLRGIAHLAEWTIEDAGDRLPSTCTEHLQKMQDRIELMDGLLRDLLAYSRAGKIDDRLVTVDTNELVQQLASLLDRPAEFGVHIEGDLPSFETLRTPLETCLRNLMANAIKHHDRSDGTVTISATVDSHFVHFVVADDGPGIAHAYHDRIFKIFHTLAAKDSGDSGSGVGLAIIKKTVESYGGSIGVESDIGQGARFILHWPRKIADRSGVEKIESNRSLRAVSP
ncbi:Phytochrome-like protein cph1 [Roseimaritima ulvae]|uniref:histidine kinase n=1 Tax=Roseimaritima ulvae TaxID=980254 RepID=A0A5B9QSA3_9BACT|nr:Phytochrome-like protein cph1 [Roseimaritima ulvae]